MRLPVPKVRACTHTCTHARTHTTPLHSTPLHSTRCILHVQDLHDAYHQGEREYAEDFWFKGEEQPEKITAMTMDAPTETQFDIPVQQRTSHDPVKSLESARKWQSKIMGLMVAGMGMMAYVTRAGLGSGSNLACTVLYLALNFMVQNGRVFGSKLHILLDGTAADNKNNTMIFFLAWLVQMDIFIEASFFCMVVGHTFSRIDQSFRTLITHLHSLPIWTVCQLLSSIRDFLAPYTCLEVRELHCFWDWKAFFAPHVHQKFEGFATGSYGSGMHEFLLRKNRDGVVCLWVRSSSKASGWFPEGEGYPVFNTIPTGRPQLAAGKADSQCLVREIPSQHSEF